MNSIIQLILFGLIIQSGISKNAQESCDWLRPLLKEKSIDNWQLIPEEDIYEVVASKEEIALSSRLDVIPFKLLTNEIAKYFAGSCFQNKTTKKPYIVRSVYGHGGTGSYTVSRCGNDLLIEHSSLGQEVIYHKSALILKLDFEPEQVYIVCSIGK